MEAKVEKGCRMKGVARWSTRIEGSREMRIRQPRRMGRNPVRGRGATHQHGRFEGGRPEAATAVHRRWRKAWKS